MLAIEVARFGGPGGYAEQAIVNLDATVAVPDGVSPLDAVAVVHDGPTALRIARVVDIQPGELVLVLRAAGGMGILLVQLLRARGARVIGAPSGSFASVSSARPFRSPKPHRPTR